jgi:hypothetical protein
MAKNIEFEGKCKRVAVGYVRCTSLHLSGGTEKNYEIFLNNPNPIFTLGTSGVKSTRATA